jgi:hypothetical protein
VATSEDRVRKYTEFIRRWAWAISLGMALLGAALFVPWSTDPISWGTLVTVLVSWLVLYVAVRAGARAAETMIFPGER